jgi:hypothetical protein
MRMPDSRGYLASPNGVTFLDISSDFSARPNESPLGVHLIRTRENACLTDGSISLRLSHVFSIRVPYQTFPMKTL